MGIEFDGKAFIRGAQQEIGSPRSDDPRERRMENTPNLVHRLVREQGRGERQIASPDAIASR
jgi:hypothetical protein